MHSSLVVKDAYHGKSDSRLGYFEWALRICYLIKGFDAIFPVAGTLTRQIADTSRSQYLTGQRAAETEGKLFRGL